MIGVMVGIGIGIGRSNSTGTVIGIETDADGGGGSRHIQFTPNCDVRSLAASIARLRPLHPVRRWVPVPLPDLGSV
jgi:hypothetical protein